MLSCQGPTGNGIDTCLVLVIVQEAIQPRFRCGVITTVDSSFLPMLLCSELMVEMVEILTRLWGSIPLYSPLNPIDPSEWEPRLDIETPFKGQGKGSPRRTDKCYNTPPHKEEEQDDKLVSQPRCPPTLEHALLIQKRSQHISTDLDPLISLLDEGPWKIVC